jgi:hypothetical protein
MDLIIETTTIAPDGVAGQRPKSGSELKFWGKEWPSSGYTNLPEI